MADTEPSPERMKHNLPRLHVETHGQTASFIFHPLHWVEADPRKVSRAFALKIKGIVSLLRQNDFFDAPTKRNTVSGEGGGDNMREQCIQAPCINPFFQPRFAEHTCLRLAVPYFAPRTFTEQLKSFISLCPDKPEFKRNLNKMKQLHDPTPKSVS